MPEDLFIPVAKQTTVTETVGVTLRELTMYRADADSPGVLALVLAPLDKPLEEGGKWRDDVQGVLVRLEDDPTSTDPQQRYLASMFQQMMFTAIVADTPTHQALGVANMSVWDAAKVLAPQFLAMAQAAAAAKAAASATVEQEQTDGN